MACVLSCLRPEAHQLICRIWLKESMPSDWNLSVVPKNGDSTICANHGGISLLPIAFKILRSVLCGRLKPHAKALIGSYQCGFRNVKPTIDPPFTSRQILEKRHEIQDKTHHLFVDFKAAFDSPVVIAYIPQCLSSVFLRR